MSCSWVSLMPHVSVLRSSTVSCCSVTKSCLTFCNPMDCSTPGFPVHHYLPEFAQTHVHWISDSIQPSHPLSLPSSPAINLPPRPQPPQETLQDQQMKVENDELCPLFWCLTGNILTRLTCEWLGEERNYHISSRDWPEPGNICKSLSPVGGSRGGGYGSLWGHKSWW